MLLSEIHLYHALINYHIQNSRVAKPLSWKSTDDLWQEMAEVEAVLNVTKITTTLSQHERLYTGAFGGQIKGTTMAALRSDTLRVIDLKSVTSSPRLPHVLIDVSKLTELGNTCRIRAILEGERR